MGIFQARTGDGRFTAAAELPGLTAWSSGQVPILDWALQFTWDSDGVRSFRYLHKPKLNHLCSKCQACAGAFNARFLSGHAMAPVVGHTLPPVTDKIPPALQRSARGPFHHDYIIPEWYFTWYGV